MNRANSLKAIIGAFMKQRAIPREMEQNLVKEAIHVHLLSALSEAGILRRVTFQGGTALRLCYAGERYSEDLDFVCGKSGSYLDDLEFAKLIQSALDATKRSLQREFDVDPSQVTLKHPQDPSIIRGDKVAVAAWQIVVPINAAPRSPKSSIKIEFANVPSYDSGPRIVRVTPGLVQVQDVILAVESPNEMLADKAVALTARPALKYRDLWDVWYLINKLDARIDRDMVQKKFADYGTEDVEAKARVRLEELSQEATAKAFFVEMRRFLPEKRVAEITDLGLQHAILAESGNLIRRSVLADKPLARPSVPANKPLIRPSVLADKPRFYITTAISYPNGVPHIGHAYEAIATDAIARFMRLDGYDVYFLTGTDEHGIKMLQTANREGMSARELSDRNVLRFRAMVERLNCSNDDFIRTTEARHHRSSAAIWERIKAAGDIYLSKYSGWYSVRDEAYYDESETRLAEDGKRLGPQGTPVEWVEEASYFFKLSAYQDKLLDLYRRVPDFVLPRERLNEVSSFVRGGLKDLSISRTTFTWGIPVPDDPKHIMYVWMDALTNYITAVGYPDTESAKFRRYWPADLHVIGKDIVRFHAVYWPAFLMSAGIEVPRRIFSHGFLFNRGEKMSKSVGNVVDPFALADAYGVDQLRYFLLREVPFGQDGSYSHDAIVARVNADLANDLGNLAQRSLSIIAKNRSGTLPTPGGLSESDKTILAAADALIDKAREAMKTQQLHQVLNAAWAVVADANRYFAGEAPWALAKTDPLRQGTVLYTTAEVIRQIAIVVQPFMPQAAARLLDLIAVPVDRRDFAELGAGGRLTPGSVLPPPAPVFPRYVEPEPAA